MNINKNHKKRKGIFGYLTERNILVCFLIISIVIISSPFLLRTLLGNHQLIGNIPYYDSKCVEDIKNNSFPCVFDPYHYVQLVFSFILPINLISIILPALFTFIYLIIFYLILTNLKIERFSKSLILFIFLTSPAFVYSYTFYPSISLTLLVFFLSFLLMLKDPKIARFFSFLLFILLPIFNILASIIAVITLLLAKTNLKIKKEDVKKKVIWMLIVSFFYFAPLYFKPNLLLPNLEIRNTFFQSVISDLGGMAGFGVFVIMLALIGFVVTIKSKEKLYYSYLMIVLLLVTSLYFLYSFVYLSFLVSIFAAIGLRKIIKMKWQLKLIKTLTILALFYGIIFSFVSFGVRVVNSEPNDNTINALLFLKPYEKGIVLSDQKYTYLVENVADMPFIFDESFKNQRKNIEIKNDVNILFHTRDVEELKILMHKNQIAYVILDSDIKNREWKLEDDGLLIMLTNDRLFKNIYKNQGIEIWEYKLYYTD